MYFGEIFSNSLKYPISDYQKLLIVGVIFVLTSLSAIFLQFGIYNKTLSLIFGLVAFIANILLFGYGLSVIKQGIELEDVIPDFDWVTNFVDGIKYIVVSFVYLLIPTLITTVVAFALGSGPLSKILTQDTITAATSGNSTQLNLVLNSIPKEVWGGLFTAIAVTSIIAIILFVIFGLFLEIGICRLAKYDSIGEAFSFGQIWSDLKEIGIFKVLGFIIVLSIICSLIGIVIGVVSAIPFVGALVATLVVRPFMLLFSNRAVGLLYSEI